MSTSALNDIDLAIRERVQYWLQADFDEDTKCEIREMIAHDRKALVDAFYTNLSFGTGGLRGIMGVGSNRMNVYTVGWATQGLANYLKTQYPKNEKLRVAIGYDSRRNSEAFALRAASVLAASGITAYLFSELRPTPLVSFACRYMHCHAAIMVTASHNPPNYNGYKVYWNDGAQVLPPHDEAIIREVMRLSDPAAIGTAPLDHPLIVRMGADVDAAYLQAITDAELCTPSANEHVNILYSSLHGTGITLMPQALKQFGFRDVALVKQQCIPDPNFPTCPRPNPEEKEALKLGIEQMLREGHDIFIATDPDADRVGVVVRHMGEAVILNGNQIACLLVHFICTHMKLPTKAAFVKTIVTTELFRLIVEAHGGRSFDVLTGFKYIAEKIRNWQADPNGPTYVFGGEESYGYLFGTHVRDKDAIISSCLIAQCALVAKRQGKTLVDWLNDLYMEFGLFKEVLISLNFEESKTGKEAMSERMKQYRNAPHTMLAGEKIIRITDLQTRTVTDCQTGRKEPCDYIESDVLIWQTETGSKVILRPSGTEPKIKIYLMLYEPKGFLHLQDAEKSIELKSKKIKDELKL